MIRLYLDEDVHKQVASALRIRGFDVISAHELNNWNMSDEQQLAFAVSAERALFSFNRGDFSRLHEKWLSAGKDHWGIITSKQVNLAETIQRLNRVLNTHKATELKNQILWL